MPNEQAAAAESAPANSEAAVAAVESATTETETAVVKPEGDTENTEVKGAEPTEKPLGEKGAAEIKRLRKRAQDAEKEAAYLRGKNEALEGKGGKTESKDTDLETVYAKQNPEPTPDQFATNGEYLQAVRKWDRGLIKFEQEQTARISQERKGKEEFEAKIDSTRTRGEEKYEDFAELVSATDIPMPAFMAANESAIGEDIIYHLAKNPAELARIEKLSPILQAKEIGRIETAIESGKIRTKPEVKRISTAPEPAPSVKANAGGTSAEPPKDMDAYAVYRGF